MQMTEKNICNISLRKAHINPLKLGKGTKRKQKSLTDNNGKFSKEDIIICHLIIKSAT